MNMNSLKLLVRNGPSKIINFPPNYNPISLTRSFGTSLVNNNIQIDVTPKEALLDDSPKIRVEGLKENQNVTLWNTFIDDSGLEFSAHAHYIANKNGVIDVQNDVSIGGRYKGIFSEGLVAAMHCAPVVYREKPKLKWARLFKRNIEKPLLYTLRIMDGHLSQDQLYSNTQSKSIGETTFIRHIMANGVRRIEVEEKRVRGILFLPPGDGPFPVILDVHGVEPGAKESRAAMLASYGYAAMVLPYNNYKDLPKTLDKLDLTYFLEALDFLNNLPQGNHGRIGYMGTSKGGEIGIALGGISDLLKAIITINSYNFSVDVDYYLGEKFYQEKFTASPETMNIFVKNEKLVTQGKSFIYTWDYKYTHPTERIKDDCYVLSVTGDEDGCHAHRSSMACKERSRKFKKENFNVLMYPGAGHIIDPPFHSHIDAIWNTTVIVHKEDGTRYKGVPHFYGGNPYDTCQAAKDLWKRALALFHRRLVQEPGLPANTAKLYPPYAT